MPGKYYINTSTDVAFLAASQVHDGAPFPVNFKGEAFQKGNKRNGWSKDTTNVELSGYKVGADPSTATTVSVVKRGCYPVVEANFSNAFWSTSTAGTYKVIRTDSVLTVGSTTFYPHEFRDGVIPQEVALFLVAGGSGGGGNSYYKKDKDNYPLVPGSGAGGSGMTLGWINLMASGEKVITIGAAGAAGSNGTSGKTSAGGDGGKGGESNYTCGSTKVMYASSGVPGQASSVSDGSYTLAGYSVGYSGNYTSCDSLKNCWCWRGSDGCSPLKEDNSTWNSLDAKTNILISGTGYPKTQIITAKNWGSTCSTDTIGSNTWFSGGNSYSAGAHYDGVGWYEYCNTPGGGGGGSGAQLRTAGAPGLAIMCY